MESTDESSPQWPVAASAQHAGMGKLWIGITTPVHDLLPHGTGVASVGTPAVPARPTAPLPLLPAPARAPLPPPPAALRLASEALPPQAGSALAASNPHAHTTLKVRQNIARECSMRAREMRALPAAAHAPPERGFGPNKLRSARRWRLGFVQARAFLRARLRSGPPSSCTTSSHNSGLFISAPNSGGCRCPAAANQR